MKIIPEIDLEDDLEIPYKPELHSWIVDNLLGLRKVRIQVYKRRDSYDGIGEIEFFSKGEKNTPTDKPRHEGREIKPDEICEMIMKFIQFDCDSKDTGGKYRIQCLRNMGPTGEKVISKHIDVPLGGEEEARFSSPHEGGFDSENQFQQLMRFNSELWDKNMGLINVLTNLVVPLQTQNNNLHKTINELNGINVRVKELEFQRDMWAQEKELENKLKIEQAKYSKQKWDNFYKYIEKANVAPMVMGAIAAKLNIDPKMMAANQAQAQVQTQHQQQNTQFQEESIEEQQARFQQQLRLAPLQTMANFLHGSLDDSQKEEILEHLEEPLYKDLEKFLLSTSERDARNNYKELSEKIAAMENPMRLAKVMECLNEQQNNVLKEILNFKM